ncbi:hypothetical protein D9611_011983 [Ephemerocybe angulata]|uniref:DUF6533 domain-containing protein n=1 Tax=Ephemerocybe angulata TaxID=980116 RepID=A0A8H5FF98_9AGAR|nr:hypothetical protein D9611_011983 [Tulosesus angulatus]
MDLLSRALSSDQVNHGALGDFAELYRTNLTWNVIDFLHTFPDEVQLMWPTAFSIPKLLYFFVRYWVFVNGILAALTTGSLFPTENTSEQCIANIKAAIGILFYRVWAFSGKDNRMLIYLIVQFIVGIRNPQTLEGVGLIETNFQVIHVLLFYFVVRFMTTVKCMASLNVAVNWLAYGGYKYIFVQ